MALAVGRNMAINNMLYRMSIRVNNGAAIPQALCSQSELERRTSSPPAVKSITFT